MRTNDYEEHDITIANERPVMTQGRIIVQERMKEETDGSTGSNGVQITVQVEVLYKDKLRYK